MVYSKKSTLITLLLLANLSAVYSSERLVAPICYSVSDQLKLTANGFEVPVVRCTEVYDYSNFSTNGPVTVTLSAADPIRSYNISPHSLHIDTSVQGNTLTFTLKKPAYAIVKINALREIVIAVDGVETDIPPSSGSGIYNISTEPYRTDNSGQQYATQPIQAAIDAANKAGGGIVFVPAGVYKCGNLFLKSNVSLYLQEGAVLRGSGIPADYSHDFRKVSVGGMDGTWFISTEAGAKDVRIFGRGTIDANGGVMRTRDHFLSHAVVPMACSGFTMDGVTVRDAGLWSVIPTRSNHVKIQNTKIYQEDSLTTENDALDVQECQDVLVDHVIGISQDDSFSTKTWGSNGKELNMKYPGNPQGLRNVVFNDCIAWSHCAAFKAGNGSGQEQSDVTFRNSCAYMSRWPIKMEPKNGSATYRNFNFENIDAESYWIETGKGQNRWLFIQLATAGHIENVKIQGIHLASLGEGASMLLGYDAEHRIDGISFQDIAVNGVSATSLKDLNVTKTNSFVNNVTIITGTSEPTSSSGDFQRKMPPH